MKNLMPLVLLLVMGVMLFISWSNVSSFRSEATQRYENYIHDAEELKEKKVYSRAIQKYRSALNMHPNEYETAMEIVRLYQKLEDDENIVSACRTAIACGAKKPEPYLIAAKQYYAEGELVSAYEILRDAEADLKDAENVPEDQMKEISKMLLELLGTYHVYVFEYDQFYGFHSVNGTADERARVQIGDKFGLISGSGSTTVPVEYEDVGLTGDELIPVKQGGEYYYMDSNGYRQIVTKKPATAIGTFGSELAPVQVDGKYGYIDTDMKEGHFDYEFAGSFENGVAAVKKGGKWGLIDTTFAERVPCQFDEILVDGYGFGTTYGVFFAKSGGSYALYDLSGNQLAGGFSEARMFASKEPAAVKKDGKWCFVSREGEIVLTPDQNYEDANSFSAGYAAVKKGGKWGCIETQGRMVIQPEFDVLLPFSRNGYAYAEQEDQQLFVAVSLLE